MLRRIISTLLALTVIIALALFIHSAINIDSLVSELNRENDYSSDRKHIFLVAPELNTPYWRLVEQGAREQAQQYGYLLQYIGPERHDIREIERLLQKAVASSPDAIVTPGFANDNDIIALAYEQDITVITVDTDSPSSHRLAYVGTDHAAAGEQLAKLMLEHITTPATLGVVMGSNDEYNQSIRLAAFQEAIANEDIEIVSLRTSNISRLRAAEVTIEMLELHPEIDALVGLSGLDALGIVDGLGALQQHNISVFGFDNLSSTETFIAEQKMIGSIVQQPEQIGKHAIQVLHQYFEKEAYVVNTYIPTTILTKQGLAGLHEN